MINSDLKPTDKFIKFIEPDADKHGKLKILIQVYADAPVGTTKLNSIHTTITITEDEDKKFGMECYEIIFTEKQVREAFKNIAKNPMKFKNQ